MKRDRLRFRFVLFTLKVLVGLSEFSARTAQASCAGGGVDVDLIATGTVEDIKASQTSSRIEVLVDRVLQGDRSNSGRTLRVRSDSGTDGASSVDVGFREGARYSLYLQRSGEEWTTNICLGTVQIPEESSEKPPIMPETGGLSMFLSLAIVGVLVFGAGAAVSRWAGVRTKGGLR